MQQLLSIASQMGPLLQATRKSAGLTQTELARRLDLSQSRLSTMELDPATIRLDQLLAWLAALQLELLVQSKAPGAVASPGRPSDYSEVAQAEW